MSETIVRGHLDEWSAIRRSPRQDTRQVVRRIWRSQVALKRLLLVKVRDPCSYHEINSPLLRSGSVLSRNLWTDVTAVAPSPIAKATRFGMPLRQSPAANTPGRLVSRLCRAAWVLSKLGEVPPLGRSARSPGHFARWTRGGNRFPRPALEMRPKPCNRNEDG